MTTDLSVTRLIPLSPHTGVPRYRQIADQLARLIADAPPGLRLPSEHEIVAHLAVSRATATQALRDLEQRGLVHRQQGRGSFTADVNRAGRTGGLPSFSEDLRQAGRHTHETLIACAEQPAPPEVAGALMLPAGGPVWRVERVVVGDGEPVVHVTSWLPGALYPGFGPDGLESSSLYELLDGRYGTDGRPVAADERWRAQSAPRTTAKLLELPSDAPVLRVERTGYHGDGTPAEYAVSYLRGDTFMVAIRIPDSTTPRLQASTR